MKRIIVLAYLVGSMAYGADYWPALMVNPTNGAIVSPTSNLVFTGTFSSTTFIGNNPTTDAKYSSTNSGTEGIRYIGALGGYTLEEFLEDTYTSGPSRDKPTFTYSGYPTKNLVVSYSGGDVYSPSVGYFHLSGGSKTLTDSSINYAYWSTNTPTIIQWKTGERPNEDAIVLARFSTSLGAIISFDDTHAIGQVPLYMLKGQAELMPSLVITPSGILAYPTGTAFSNVAITAGFEYQDMIVKREHYSRDLSNTNTTPYLVYYYKTNGTFLTATTNIIPVGSYNDGTNVVACQADKWYRGLFVSRHDDREMHFIIPQSTYTNEESAIAGTDPNKPSGFEPYFISSTAYIFKGDDTELRQDSKYWVDRRTMIRSGAGNTISGSGGVTTPALEQVMRAGSSLGGILPHDAGLPVDNDELTSKEYVDSTINRINGQKAYVDIVSGSNETARIESSILPYKTIQAAIDACAAVANDGNRYSVVISPGLYREDVSISNYVSLVGSDIQATRIEGSVTFPHEYTDVKGSEIGLLSVVASNKPALLLDAGSDQAYMGVRSCSLTSTYYDGQTNKSVVLISRGVSELYATTFVELVLSPTSNTPDVRNAQAFEHTTDPLNVGLSEFTSFNSSVLITSSDTDDDVSLMYTHDNTDPACINTLVGTVANVYLNTVTNNYSNLYKQINHKRAAGRSLSMGTVTRLNLATNNSVSAFFGYASAGTTDNVAIVRGNHIRMSEGSTSNAWLGAATGVNDSLRVYDSVYIQNYATKLFPKLYTADGSAGKFFVNSVSESGDHLFGGALDLANLNSAIPSTPEVGHTRVYVNPYAGLEQLYTVDSSGNTIRLGRDSLFNGYVEDGATLPVGTPVYRKLGRSPQATPIVGKCYASDPATMPCVGIVVQPNGITNGGVGRVMFYGRTESYFNTTCGTNGSALYVGEGTVTNIAPVTGIKQQIGSVHTSSTNGWMSVQISNPDTLGGLNPSAYITYANPTVSDSKFVITNSGASGYAKFSVADVPVGTTNTYILPSVGGTLATYTDIQLVPVSAVVGEVGGILKGRAVYLSGVDVNGRPVVKYADKANPAGLPVIGVTTASGVFGAVIEVANFGPIPDIDTSTFTDGENIYLGTAGALERQSSTLTDAIIILGTCGKADAVNGSMLVNIITYFMDGGFAGSMRYTVKNASDATNATSVFFAMNSAGQSMRMGVRGTNYFRGQGGFLVNNAGQTIFGNGQRERFVWGIDMTDSGNDYNHLNWPMMALVPQAGVASNAFLGVGTTNPLAMLHVAGDAIITNSLTVSRAYRTLVNSYTSTEFITYGATTNLTTGIVNTQSATNQLFESRISGVEGRTSVWNTASVPSSKFLANIGTTANQTFGLGTNKFSMTNLVLNVGGTYTTASARWTPGASNVMIRLEGHISGNLASTGDTFDLSVYRNGVSRGSVLFKRCNNAADELGTSFSFIDITGSATDFYELIGNATGAVMPTTGSGLDNWWSGQIVY